MNKIPFDRLNHFLASYPRLWMILLLLALSFRYGYYEKMSYRPQGVHQWRQADCASMALNYYKDGMHFFDPEIHALIADQGASGHLVSELPVLPYFTAALYHIFGFNESWFRWINYLTFFCGMFYLFLFAKHWIKDTYWAMLVPATMLTSPVLVYYANNFLSDSAAFSLVFPGWYYASKALELQKRKFVYAALFFFVLATLLKVSAGISLVAFVILILVWAYTNRRLPYTRGAVIAVSIAVLLSILSIFVWYIYAIQYNAQHSVNYFGTRPMPLWVLDAEQIRIVWDAMRHTWYHEYFHPYLIWALPALLLIPLLLAHQGSRFLWYTMVLIFLGSSAYFILWYEAFRDHDYYLINIYILPAFLMIGTLFVLSKKLPRLYKSVWLKLPFILILILFINHASKKLESRYHGWGSELEQYGELMVQDDWLSAQGIGPQERIISWPDYTSCYSLYMLERKGWTSFALDNNREMGVEMARSNGAAYLVHIDTTVILPQWLRNVQGQLKARKGRMAVYEIKK